MPPINFKGPRGERVRPKSFWITVTAILVMPKRSSDGTNRPSDERYANEKPEKSFPTDNGRDG